MAFRSLRTKLAVIYTSLFALVMAVAAGAAFTSVQRGATRMVQDEMAATAAVFDRIWVLHARQMGDAADILSRDFGFRAAVATRDVLTLESALDNLKQRFEFDIAFVIDQQGDAVGAGANVDEADVAAFMAGLTDRDAAGGVILVGGAAYHAVARPVRAPTHVGWVVFAYRLSPQGLNDLTALSAIPLQARLFWQAGSDDWRSAQLDDPGLEALLGPVPAAQSVGFSQDGQALVSAIAVTPFSDNVSALLVLQYPVAQAMAPFHSMMLVILSVSLAGLLVIILGSWLVSRSLARPILALERAADRLARGERGGLAKVSGEDEIARLAESFNAMSEQIAAREQRITHMALHDTDTGVPNLAALENEVDSRRTSSGRGRVFAVLVGIDRFDKVRGAIGYALSSHMIADLVQRLEGLCPDAFVGRVSTDTLGLIFEADSVERVLEQAKAIMIEANKPGQLGADQVDIHATVGVAALEDTQGIGLTVIECAGVAVNQARARGERLGQFDGDAYGDPARTLSLMSRMIEGLGSGDLFLAYQPKHDFRAQAVTACEALLRWRDPERGFIGPDEFIPLAEETGHILPLTEWVLDRAIADQVRMKAAGHDLQVAINVSGRLISDPRFVAMALDRLSRHSGRICFEITETAVIENPDQALEHMNQLRTAGVSVSIDDYGSGLSSLAYLRSIPAEELKIDKAFVMELHASHEDRLLVKSTIDLAHSLGLKVTAEGVENAESTALLAGMGADFAQGYHIGRPMPLADFLGHISALTSASKNEPLRRVQG